MINLSINTCVKALHGAALSRKAAFQTELGVSFAIYLMQGGTDRAARQLLTETYATAGYACLAPTDADYKTINRRINATADLFNTIKLRTVKKWAGDHGENQLIAAMVEGLRPYELHTVSDMLRYCTPAAGVAPRAAPTTVEPHRNILTGPMHTGQKSVMDQFRRVSDRPADDVDQIKTDHVHVTIPKDATHDELLILAQKILALAQERTPVAA